MGEDLELAAKASAETITALAEASGALGPSQEVWGALTSGIHYRFYPRVIKQAMAAAEKIRESGLPTRAYSEVSDRLLRAILEGGAMEGDEAMQERWANLLANALTEGAAEVHPAFPAILAEIEPSEAALLDRWASMLSSTSYSASKLSHLDDTVGPGGSDNLVRLRLLDYSSGLPMTISDGLVLNTSTIAGSRFTWLGWAFVQACRSLPPQSMPPR
jgi:hypothetical protein